MRQRSAIIVLLAVVLAAFPASSQEKKITFDGQAAFGYVKDLASDGMAGRKSGEPSGLMGAGYVAAKLKAWGLEPAGPNGGYIQEFPFEYYEVERGASLGFTAHNRTREFVYGEDWRQYQYSGSAVLGAGVVFVGYGISAPDKQYDEYAGVDVKDKLVLFSTEAPRKLKDTLQEESKLTSRIKAARAHGARGILTFRSDASGGGYYPRGDFGKEIYDPAFLMLSLESRAVDFIFKWQKADPRYFFQQIETTGKPQSYDLGVQALVNLKVNFDEKRMTQNVLAKIPGTDPKLKNEVVIAGAHMDHLGVDMTGDVLNGADDNASGTAVVMEAARVLKLNRFKPKRTILFALWGAEEDGLLGSKYYTEHPVYPLEKTVANINLDMEGHGTGKVSAGGAYYAPEIWDILKARLPKDILDNVLPSRGGVGGSDHTYFLYNGVPAFMVITDGSHFKTNRVGDVIGLIQPDILRNAGVFVVSALEILSQEPNVPILAGRKEMFFWRHESIVNHEMPPLGEIIEEHKDAQDADVDYQFAVLPQKEGLAGDALRLDLLKGLLEGKDKLAQTKGLALFGTQSGGGWWMSRGPQKTNVLVGLRGLGAIRDDLGWAEVFSKQGLHFIALDDPAVLFDAAGLSEEGKKILDALGKTGLLLIVDGLDSARAKALLEYAKKPVFLRTGALPDEAVLDLVKKTGSVVGLVLGKDEAAAPYWEKVAAARKRIGPEYVSIVNEKCVWGKAGREQMLAVIAEMLKATPVFSDDEIAAVGNLFSGSLLRILGGTSR